MTPARPRSDGRVRVVIADDHAVVRSGLEQLLSGFEDVELVGGVLQKADVCAHVLELVQVHAAVDPPPDRVQLVPGKVMADALAQ